jgi:hypothetical protein
VTETQLTGQALSVLHMVVEARELLFRVEALLVSQAVGDSTLRTDAWHTVNGRFQLVVFTLTDPEYLEANEDLLTEFGLEGPEIEFRRDQFDRVIARQEKPDGITQALRASKSILRSLAGLPIIGPTAHAIADYVDAVTGCVESMP